MLRSIGFISCSFEEIVVFLRGEDVADMGYTDAVGDESYNLLLSDRRAETVALALSEYFGVRPENMVVQGYGGTLSTGSGAGSGASEPQDCGGPDHGPDPAELRFPRSLLARPWIML